MSAEQEQQKLRKQIEALAPALLPKGVGAYSAVALEYELKGLARFKTARALSSYTGLCPGIHSSDGRGKEGSINRCGNAAVRWNLVEMVWRLLKCRFMALRNRTSHRPRAGVGHATEP